MKKDLKSVIEKVSSFLGKQLSQEQVKKNNDNLSFIIVKKNQNQGK